MSNDLDRLCVNTLRFLAVDAVEKARSGHPGLPLGAAPMAYALWDRCLRHNPADPHWFDRDRFILSAGHGCALLYALLHMTGYDLPLSELQQFRQWGSRTPGHPEYRLVPGAECTTGPLGQGFATGVGMALAEAHLAAAWNRDGAKLVDHFTYAIVSDGDLMEGIASEAASLAGHLGLGKLIYLYDDNHISIDGPTELAFTEDRCARFEAYGWQVQRVEDGNDLEAVEKAIRAAQAETARPSLISVHTHIGYGSPKQDSADAHGEPLGAEAAKATKEKLGWPLEPAFYVPEAALAHMRQARERAAAQQAEWQKRVEEYARAHPAEGAEVLRRMKDELPSDWKSVLPTFPADPKGQATRASSGTVINALAAKLPELAGGSADLTPSNKTAVKNGGTVARGQLGGRNLHFGVREHAMAAAVNGMALHGGMIPYAGTFLIFSDYMKPALRLAALMEAHSIFVFTHDSIGLGEDGPTHQPVEHLMALRAVPGMTVLRPADANETAAAWQAAIEREGPVALALSRQNLPVLDAARFPIRAGVPRGAYILAEAEDKAPEIILIATGSEVHLALGAREQLAAQKIAARVVSMPSWELFEEQPEAYRREVLPAGVPKLAIEAGATLGWYKYVGERGGVLGLDRFGASAPGGVAMEKLGFNVAHVVERARGLLKR